MDGTLNGGATQQRRSRIKSFFALSLSFALGVLASVAVVVIFTRWTSDFTKYTGEGVHRETLTALQRIRWLPFTLLPRYEIEFTAFDMRQPFVKEFRIAGLPRNVRGDARIKFRILSLNRYDGFYNIEADAHPTGSLRLRLLKNGEEMFDCSGDIASWPYKGGDPYPSCSPLCEHIIYYDDDSTFFAPDSLRQDDVLTLLVEYEPGTDPVQGFCIPILRAGGHF